MRIPKLTKTLSLPLVLLAAILLVTPLPALAAASPLQTFTSGALVVTSTIIMVLNFLAWLMLSILDHIMDPNYIFGLDQNGADGPLLLMLREIWQFSRDLVNIGFALAMVIGAIMMIVTADGSKVKESIPKFVIALVLVNFSWFIPRVIFDFSQIMTYTVYQIPSLMGQNDCVLPPAANGGAMRPCEVVLKFKFFEQQTRTIATVVGADGTLRDSADGSTGWSCPLGRIVCIQKVPINQAPANVRTSTKVLDGLVVNHARLQWLAQIQVAEADARAADGENIVALLAGPLVKMFIVLVIHVAIVFPLAAMVAAFFIRIPVLWVSMAFMPLVALGYAFPSLKEKYKELFWDWQDHFLQAVFLPVKVAVPFVIGFIMLNAGAQLPIPQNFGDQPLLPIFTGIGNLWQVMWMGIALFIIWKYSFEQLKGDKAGLMGHFTERIEGIGSSLGSFAASLPLSVPILPAPGRGVNNQGQGEGMSISQGLRGLDPRTWARSIQATGKIDRDHILREMGIKGTRPNEALQTVLRQNNNLNLTINQQLQKAAATGNDDAGRAAFTEAMQTFARDNQLQPFARRMTEREILETLMATNPVSAEQRKRLLEILEARNGGANRPAL